ncbi:hypothetical protein M3Y99_00835100 [Aphelenchoides fujianensis]|nr:hypothetical protein M3Y99_00835100 [Aphelenchoides fujianensis]
MNLDGPLPRLVQNWSVFRDGNLNYLLIADWVACYMVVVYSALSAATHFDNMASMPIANTSCTRFLPQFNANNINTPIIFFCMSSIWWFLRKQSALMSSQNKSIQFQISLTIGLQSLIPFVAYFGPVYVFSLTLDWGPYWQSIYYYLLFTSYSLVPFLNPLIPMLFVARYRQGDRGRLLFGCHQNSRHVQLGAISECADE